LQYYKCVIEILDSVYGLISYRLMDICARISEPIYTVNNLYNLHIQGRTGIIIKLILGEHRQSQRKWRFDDSFNCLQCSLQIELG